MITNSGRTTAVATVSDSLVNPAKPQRAALSPSLIAFPVFSVRLITERASSTTGQLLHEIHDLRYEAYSHWGLNE